MLFKQLKTARLTLKIIGQEDAEFFYEQFTNEKIAAYLFDVPPFESLSEAKEMIDFFIQPEPRGHNRWIIKKSDDQSIGTCGFHNWDQEEKVAEVGYDLSPEFWGQGYMSEAMKAIIAFAFDAMKVNEIHAVIYEKNPESIKLIERHGFTVIGMKTEKYQGKAYAHRIYGLTQKTWNKG